MTTLQRWGALTLLTISSILVSPSAYCQVEMELEAPRGKVEVGQQFEVKLDAQASQGSPGNPKLSAPSGVAMSSPSVGTSWRVGINNGRMTKTSGLTARWVLSAKRLGKLTIGPATVELDGSTYQSRTVTVEVVAQGSLPAPRSGRRSPFSGWPDPFDPFDPFGQMPGMGDLFGNDEPEPSDYPEELATEAALDPLAFLRITATPSRVFVGQQVTLRVFAYGSRGPFQEQSAKEPARPDFFSIPIVEGATQTDLHRVPIGDALWHAAKIREIVLFPLRAGELQIGSMEFGFGGGRYGSGGRPLVRRSQPLTITVAEPPLDGRPAGYQVGDVGRFTLGAEVSPREIEAGSSVSAVVTLNGLGNLPAGLRTPTRTGVDFLTPTVRNTPKLEAGLYGGTKVFTYIVRLDTPGTIDLGEITLPYFDPDSQQYGTARATLGTVLVKPAPGKPSGAPATNPSEPADGLTQLQRSLTPEQTLSPFVRANDVVTDKPLAWLLLMLTPLSMLLLRGGLELGRRSSVWLATRRRAPKVLIAKQLDLAQSLISSDPPGAASALERALYLTIDAKFTIKARGMLRPELEALLAKQGVSEVLRQQISNCLETCDSVRFAPLSAATMTDLFTRTRTTVDEVMTRDGGAAFAQTSSSGAAA